MTIKPPVTQRNTGAYVDVVIEHSPALQSNILEGDVTMNIKLYCSCGQPVEVSSNAGGQRFDCPSCGRQLTIPRIEKQSVPQIVPDKSSVKQEANQHADAASPNLFIRFKNFCENLNSKWETILFLGGVAATIIAGIFVVLALLTK